MRCAIPGDLQVISEKDVLMLEKMDSRDCVVFCSRWWGKFELLLVDLLCPHEPVTPEKILVILTTFYGIPINNSTKGNHHQHLKDKV